jgi:hypothetical protein
LEERIACMIDTSRLQRLLHHLQTPSTVPQADQVAASITHWFGYYRSLQRILERYRERYTAYTTALQHAQAQLPSDPATTAPAPPLAAVHDGYPALRSEMDLFCVFAKAVLDGMAETFQGYFALAWDKIAVSHARLLREFGRLCQEHHYVLDPAHLPVDMSEVQHHLEQHAPVRARHPTQQERRVTTPDIATFMRFVTLVDRYIDAMVQFLEVNVAHSILHHAISPTTPPEMPQS